MPLHVEGSRIQVLGPLESSNNMGSVRRARELADIAPQYIAKSGLCNASELESSRGGSIRIQHVTGLANAGDGKSRFPKLDECAHFHYEHVEIGPLQVSIVDDDDLKPLSNESEEGKWWSLSVTSQNRTWLIRRSYDNFRMLDQQLHRCIYDRKFSELMELPVECIEEQENLHKLLSNYFTRFSSIAGSLINCGPILNWLELDNRGHRLLVPDTDNCPINTPAVAAAYSVKRYTAQAPDEISFEVGDMISVIDMPPPEESIWWRGKRGFQVGFFPCECVAVIGDKVPRNLQITPQASQPTKPVLRKHGKLIAFFRSFILSRPSRRRLKQSGILKERVFGCDLGEHLLNSGHEIPMVLKCCVEFIETHGLVDGIYRLSGVTSNIQKLRNAFDEDRVPALYEDEAILQDVHSVASLLKMYFRELPNPLCTYQLYHQFVGAMQATQGDDTRLLKIRDVVQKLPPPHYRTLEYLMRHLARVSDKGQETGMTSRNVAIVWAPNLLRCKELEVGGVAALQGVGIQAVVTEFLVCYADLIFCDKLPNFSLPPPQVNSKKSRPKSLAISTPTKLLSLEEARNRALLQAAGKLDQDYIEVGGGPANLPAKYHTVIELPGSTRKRAGSKRSPIGWKILFGKSGRSSQSRKDIETKSSAVSDFGIPTNKAVTESDLAQNKRRLRPAKSVESLNSSCKSTSLDLNEHQSSLGNLEDSLSPMLLRSVEGKSNGHNRSVSHESYFDQLQDQKEDPSLDISEIQVNFDLEESEMRIFSEDETLMSGGSGSIASNSSPLLIPGKCGKFLISSVNKRLPLPKVISTEDRFYAQSADPSPKKKKTNEGLTPISKLEEQLSSSVGDIQFIDSVSPDQVLVEAEVHPVQSPSPVSSVSQMSASLIAPSSPILPHIPHLQRPLSYTLINCINNESKSSFQVNESKSGVRILSTASSEISPHSYLTSPSLVEATISDNESFSLQSSELTTPETPICRSYTPLVNLEESSASNMTTPDFDYICRKSSSETDNLDKAMVKANSEFDECQNIGKEVVKFEEKIKCDEVKPKCENITSGLMKNSLIKAVVPPKPEERKPRPVHPYENIPLSKGAETDKRKLLETSFDVEDVQEKLSNRNSVVSIKYEVFSRESSCDSLVNINKEENLLSLEKKTFEIESNTVISSHKESEMNLLKECSDWLESKQSVCSLSGNECFENTKNPNFKKNSKAEEWLSTRHLDSPVPLLSENSDVEIKKNCKTDNPIVTCENVVGSVSSCISVDSVPDKKDKAEGGKESFTLLDLKEISQNEDQKRSLQESEKKKILETNLDDIENLETSKIPVPKKRSSAQKSNSSGNVQMLVPKVEISSGTEQSIVDLRREFNEFKTVKDYLELRNSLEERSKTLERLSTTRKTENMPETQLEKSKSGSEINEKCEKVDSLLSSSFDLSDPQRRERIEKYKEKRRNYLREKYRSDSFKNDRDDFILKLKQRHFSKIEGGDTPKESKWSPLSSPEKKFLEKPQRRGSVPKLLESPTKNFSGISTSADMSERLGHEVPIISNAIREHSGRKSNFLRFSSERKTTADFRSLKSSPEKKSWEFSFGTNANEWSFPEFHGVFSTRRRMTDPSRPGKSGEELNVRRKFNNNVNKSETLLSGSSSTPSFCIKELAALFEKKDEPKIHKQYLSSV